MSRIAVISDSSCDYSAEQQRTAGFSVVPLTVSFGETTYTDGKDLPPKRFFELLAAAKGSLPKTSQPSPEAFREAFRAQADADHIICVTVTGESSGTVRSAQLAADLLAEEGFAPQIHIVDSRNASAAVGLMAETAAKMAADHAEISEILARLAQMQRTVALYFLLDTLEYVRRGGRIGNITAALGGLLGIKPILTFLHGAPTDIAKCRGYHQSKDKLIALFHEKAASREEIIIVHADAFDRAHALATDLKQRFGGIRIRIHAAGAIIGTYAGPGAIGLIFEEKAPRC